MIKEICENINKARLKSTDENLFEKLRDFFPKPEEVTFNWIPVSTVTDEENLVISIAKVSVIFCFETEDNILMAN